jgi:hypothetical protein
VLLRYVTAGRTTLSSARSIAYPDCPVSSRVRDYREPYDRRRALSRGGGVTVDDEAPDADVAEQATPANPLDDEEPPEPSRDPEASEWDALEQAKVVELDDEP